MDWLEVNKERINHLRLYYLLPWGIVYWVPFFIPPPSQIAFIEVLLTLLLPIVLTFGSFIWFGVSAFCTLFPLLFIIAVLLVGTVGLAMWLEGTLVLLLRMFLFSRAFSSFWSYLAFSSFTFSANLSATALAIFRICWCLLFRHPKKLTFLKPFLTLLLFL